MVQDITERKQIEDQVRYLAFYDALTGLPNRRLLIDRMVQAMAQCKRNGCHGAVILLDLDNFKPLNDRYGHAVGDLLLVAAADRLKSCVREMDTVARFGGDEFVVIISELKADHAESTVEASQDEILKWADTAMYRAKEAGRNPIRLYYPKDEDIAATLNRMGLRTGQGKGTVSARCAQCMGFTLTVQQMKTASG